MKLLVIDCAFNPKICLLDNYKTVCEKDIKTENHSDNLMFLIDLVLKENGLLINDIDSIALNIGPGSFTGLRVSFSVVKGLLFGEDKKILPFTTFDYLLKEDNVLVPAFSEFVYLKKENNMTCEKINELDKSAKYVVFDDKLLLKLKENGLNVIYKEKLSHDIILKNKKEFLLANQLEPLYLRKSQAEIEREKKIMNNKK